MQNQQRKSTLPYTICVRDGSSAMDRNGGVIGKRPADLSIILNIDYSFVRLTINILLPIGETLLNKLVIVRAQ